MANSTLADVATCPGKATFAYQKIPDFTKAEPYLQEDTILQWVNSAWAVLAHDQKKERRATEEEEGIPDLNRLIPTEICPGRATLVISENSEGEPGYELAKYRLVTRLSKEYPYLTPQAQDQAAANKWAMMDRMEKDAVAKEEREMTEHARTPKRKASEYLRLSVSTDDEGKNGDDGDAGNDPMKWEKEDPRRAKMSQSTWKPYNNEEAI